MTEQRCGTCDHRTVFMGWCAKQGRKVPASMGPCPEYADGLLSDVQKAV